MTYSSSRELFGNASTVGCGKNRWAEKFLKNEKRKAQAKMKKAEKDAKLKSEQLLAMKIHAEVKRLRLPKDSDESEIDELEEPENLETGIVALAAKSGLDLKGNTATIDEVERILKVFVKDKFNKVVLHTNERNGKVVTLEDVMRVVRKDTSVIGL